MSDDEMDLWSQQPEDEPPRRAREEFPETADGVERAYEHANDRWRRIARDVALEIARQHERFTSADVDLAMQREHPGVITHDKRAMGAVVRGLCKDGIVEWTDEIVQDPRRNCHNQNKRVWRSLIYVGHDEGRNLL